MLYTAHNHNYLWSKPLNVFWVACSKPQDELTTSSPLSRHPSFPWLSLALCLQCSSAFIFLSFSSFVPSATSLSQQKLPRSPALQGRPPTLTVTSPLHITVVMSHWFMCCAGLNRSVMSNSLWPPQTVAHQGPLGPWGFSKKEYWSGLPYPPPGDLPDPGIKPRSPSLQADSLLSEPPASHPDDLCHLWEHVANVQLYLGSVSFISSRALILFP